ncbi:MAG: PorT family protein [Prevotella sp.]|nr:PorT family protein [Prevotella sp.]
MRRIVTTILLALVVITAAGQKRKVQNKPYIDLRPLHFGIQIGLNMQDVELQNKGPQLMQMQEGEEPTEQLVLTDADTWNPGFSVGVVADMRLSQHFSLRLVPTMHFGSKHLVFRNYKDLNDGGLPRETTQDMKNTYISLPVDLKFSAERFNNYRPYMIAGISPMINLSGKDQDYIHTKRYDTMVEIGLGCDYYLPFFKFIPELKFSFSLADVFDKKHIDELTDMNKRVFANSVDAAYSKMIVLTFYFE